MANTLNSIDLGNIQSFKPRKVATNLQAIAIPGLDSDSSETFDLGGTIRRFEIISEFSSATAAANVAIYESFFALIDGDQQGVTLSSDFMTSDATVKVESCEVVDWKRPGTIMVVSLSLVEGV